MRRNRTVPSHRPVGFADGLLIFPGSDFRNSSSSPRFGGELNKVAAGMNPAAVATLAASTLGTLC